ncbi:hypothetical protein [Phytopseudomonas flavescens]|uniref:hypothetical protein n=1 Tax=Phytopseudomonas flavescens TaxID=29435 RepID=UPI0011134270|nr:hypothetical protein [Pseudomonas flavescens]
MPKIVQITPCTGWFYVADTSDPRSCGVFEPVAAWALLDDGSVVGLMNDGRDSNQVGGAFLTPPVAQDEGDPLGDYLHESQLDELQLIAARLT